MQGLKFGVVACLALVIACQSAPQGQQIHTYGGWWYLVALDGEPIETGILPDTDG